MQIYKDLSPSLKIVMQWLAVLLSIGLVASSFAFALSYTISALKMKHDTTGARQISVNGEGKITMKPDIAVFTATIVSEGQSVGDVQTNNTTRSNAVIAYVKQSKVEEKDIKTVGYSISPIYESTPPCRMYPCPNMTPHIVSYHIEHAIEIKVRNLAKASGLLEGVVKNGANDVGSLMFKIDNDEQAKADARKQAIDNAQAKAEVLAHDLGVRLGKIISFSESNSGVPIFFVAMNAGMSAKSVSTAPSVEPGEQEIQSNVTINYELK